MQKKQLKSLLAGVLFALFAFSSCVDNDYDLSKDMSLDVTIGAEGFSFPIGYSEKIMLTQLLDIEKSDILEIVDGQFAIQKEDEIAGVDKRIDAVDINVDIKDFDPISVGFIELPEGVPGLPPGKKVFETDVNSQTFFSIDQEITDDLVSLKSVKFVGGESGEEPAIKLILGVGNVIIDDVTLTFAEGSFVKFPAYIKFKAGQEGVDEFGTLKLGGEKIYPGGYSKTLIIEKMDWDTNPVSQVGDQNRLILPDEAVTLNGKVTAGVGEDVTAEQLNLVKITPSATMATLYVGEVEGTIDPDIDPIEEMISLDLGEDLDFLTEEGTTLNLYNPQIKLSLSNNVKVPILLENLELVAMDKSGGILASVLVEPLTLDAAVENGTAKITNFYLSRQESRQESDAAQYKTVKVEDLHKLMEVVPDRIKLRVQPKATGNDHVVDLNKDIIIEGAYAVFVPLEFESLDITYSDVMDDLKKDLKDIAEELLDTKLDIVATIGNTIPLPFEVFGDEMVAVDEYGQVINDITVKVKIGEEDEDNNSILAGKIENGVAREVETKLTISLESKGKSLKDLDGLKFIIKSDTGATPSESLPLRSDQYFQMRDVKIVIKNNLDFNFN